MNRVIAPGAMTAAVLAVLALFAGAAFASGRKSHALPQPKSTVSDYVQLTSSTTPPTQAQCNSAGRRCFSPQAVQASYNVGPLYAGGYNGRGMTIAVVDSYGSDTMAHDLHVYDQTFGVAPLCGEEGVTCTAGMPKFSELHLQGSPATKAPPSSL